MASQESFPTRTCCGSLSPTAFGGGRADRSTHPRAEPQFAAPRGLRRSPPTKPWRDGAAAPGLVVGYVPGAWDVFHIGHLNILLRAREQCDSIVGVVTDEALFEAKDKWPIVPLDERLDMTTTSISSTRWSSTTPATSSRSGSGWLRRLVQGRRLAWHRQGLQARGGHGLGRRAGHYFPYIAPHLEHHVAVDPRRTLTQTDEAAVAPAMRETIDNRRWRAIEPAHPLGREREHIMRLELEAVDRDGIGIPTA